MTNKQRKSRFVEAAAYLADSGHSIEEVCTKLNMRHVRYFTTSNPFGPANPTKAEYDALFEHFPDAIKNTKSANLKKIWVDWRSVTEKDLAKYRLNNDVVYKVGTVNGIDVCYVRRTRHKGRKREAGVNKSHNVVLCQLITFLNGSILDPALSVSGQSYKDTLNAMKGFEATKAKDWLVNDPRFDDLTK